MGWNPLHWPADILKGLAKQGAALALPVTAGLGNILLRWLNAYLFGGAQQLVGWLMSSTDVDLTAGFWTGPRTQNTLSYVTGISRLVALLLVLVACLDWLASEGGSSAARAVAVGLPIAFLATVAFADVVQVVCRAVDDMTTGVMGGAGANVGHFVTSGGGTLLGTASQGGFFWALLIGFAVALFVLTLEMVVRGAAIYIVVLFAPLVLAAGVWPRLAGMRRKTLEGLAALILSKFFVVAVFALGTDMLAGTSGAGPTASAQGMAMGLGIMVVAALMPAVLFGLLHTVIVPHLGMAAGLRSVVGGKVSGAVLSAARVSGTLSPAAAAGTAGAAGPPGGGGSPGETGGSGGRRPGAAGYRPAFDPLGGEMKSKTAVETPAGPEGST